LRVCFPDEYTDAYQRAYREEHREKLNKYARKRALARNYGMTQTDWEEMYRAQAGLCLLCEEKHERLCVDHCHQTGKVRGLLCLQCNTALGKLGDSVPALVRVVSYLKGELSPDNPNH
jgi:hypothetical protein